MATSEDLARRIDNLRNELQNTFLEEPGYAWLDELEEDSQDNNQLHISK